MTRAGEAHSEALSRERRFFDAQARALDVEELPPREYAPFDSQFEDALIEAAGPIENLRILDLGSGIGDLTLRLLKRGGRVTALDISAESVELARRRIERFLPDADVDYAVAPADATRLPDESYDVVLGKWVLHHLDLDRALPEIRRLLRPGGRGVFVETSALNPLLRVARGWAGRGMIPSYGTPDERPISRADLTQICAAFPRMGVDHPNFVLFYLIDRHLLNWRFPRASRFLVGVDRWVERRVPRLGPLSYFMRIQIER